MTHKKIVFLFNSFVSISGGDIRFIEIAKRMEGLKRVVVTSLLGKNVCEREGVNSTDLTTNEKYIKYIPLTYFKRIVRSLLLRIDVKNGDLIYSSSDFLPDVLPAFYLRRKNPEVKWLASVYHLIPHPFKRPESFRISNILSYVSQRISLKLISRYADIVNTENSFLKSRLAEEFEIPSEKIIVVNGGINAKLVDGVVWNGQKMYDACFLGRIHPSKGIFDLVESWKQVCRWEKTAKLAIIGSGSSGVVQKLRGQIKVSNLENHIHLLGFLSEKEKYRVLKASKVLVHPSYEEGIPIAFYEAMYCGLPVVTYYLPSYVDIKDYIVRVPLGNAEKLGKEIIRVLEDEDLARRLGDKGRSLAKEHTWDKIADYIFSQIEKLTRERH